MPVSLYQPSLALTQLVATGGAYPNGTGGSFGFIGQVRTFGGSFGAFGAPQADGQLRAINRDPEAFSVLGSTYGGNGVTNFALPDLVGRTVIGADLNSDSLGRRTGNSTVTLTEANLPTHRHGVGTLRATGLSGLGAAFDKRQPGLDLVQMIAVNGDVPLRDGRTATPYLGQLGTFAGGFTPGGWLPADGRLLSIAANSNLFSVIGTTYGGNGYTDFALPNLVGRAAVGAGSLFAVDDVAGADSVTLLSGQMPSHSHALPGGGTTTAAGGNVGFGNYQQSLGINYLVTVRGIDPSQTGDGTLPGTPMLGEIIAFAGDYAPDGYAQANGQMLSISQNQALFSLFGTRFGGNGFSSFALPDLRDRSVIGAGTDFELGLRVGSAQTVLIRQQLPAHDHSATELAQAGFSAGSGATVTFTDGYYLVDYGAVALDSSNVATLSFANLTGASAFAERLGVAFVRPQFDSSGLNFAGNVNREFDLAGGQSVEFVYGFETGGLSAGQYTSETGFYATSRLAGFADTPATYTRVLFRANILAATVAGVPEPATWGLMIAGFGMIGAAMRRRPALAA